MIEKQLERRSDPLDKDLRKLLASASGPIARDWLSAEKFSELVQLERERADRRDIEFCLLLIELDADCRTEKHLAALLDIFVSRLRNTDQFCRLGEATLAVVLPDTPPDGGSFVATQISEMAIDQGIRFRCRLYVYPFFGNPGDNGELQSETNSDSNPEQVVSAQPLLFVQGVSPGKRAVDVVASAAGLIVLSPLLLLAAIAVKCSSRGPILFSQLREGHGGRNFKIYKFRTMRADAEALKESLRHLSEQDGPAFKIKNDPRLTRIGKFLRRTCIDELPQLINVLRGEMTLVGPRPLPVDESLDCLRWQRKRLDVVPGLTCIWQVYGNEHTPFSEWMRMDLQYLRRAGFRADTRLIYETVKVVIKQEGSA